MEILVEIQKPFPERVGVGGRVGWERGGGVAERVGGVAERVGRVAERAGE